MKIFRKIAIVIILILAITAIGGYFYFDKKFTPPSNSLSVSGIAEKINSEWISDETNPHSALVVPVYLNGIQNKFYMQLDTGSPTTLFYKKSLQSIQDKYAVKNKVSEFRLGDMKVSSKKFPVINYGKSINSENPEIHNIIGTIGSDLLEKRIIILNFKENNISFKDLLDEKKFFDFKFKKRKILIPAKIGNEEVQLMYDSGTSGYQFITNKEKWNMYKLPKNKVRNEKGNAWGKSLTIQTTSANQKIQFGDISLNLSEVTYIEGTSRIQNFLMKSSGMQGMIGNTLFLNHILILDCKNEKFKIE